MKTVSVRIPWEMKKQIYLLCIERDIEVWSFVRRAIKEKLNACAERSAS
jgi:hypothetical protein